MLTENRTVRQEPGRQRRWFEDDGMELIVWQDAQGDVEGFQILQENRALTWRRDAGFTHARVEEGDETPYKNLTPVLLPDSAVPWPELTAQFLARSDTLETSLRELILGRLQTRR